MIDTQNREAFRANVRALRQKAGLSQRKLAELCGVDPSTVRNWEVGRSMPNQEYIKGKLGEVLGCEFEELCQDRKDA